MTETTDKVIAFVGMPGAGKTSAVDYLAAKGVPKVYFGGVVIDALKKAGFDKTPANEQYMREKLRMEFGKDVIARRIIDQIEDLFKAGQHRVLADGLYSWTEYKALKHAFPSQIIVVAIVTPRELRHKRLADRPERPLTRDEAEKRDWSEIENLEKGGPIAIADYYITNNGSLDELHAAIDRIITEIKF